MTSQELEGNTLGRREFLGELGKFFLVSTTLTSITALVACQPQAVGEKTSVLTTPKKETKEIIIPWGDIVLVDNIPFLLRGGKRFTLPGGLEKYQYLTKMDKNGRRVVNNPSFDPARIPLGEVSQKPAIIDPFTGQLKINKMFGGEMSVFFGGMLTDRGDIYIVLKPEDDMFLAINGENGLEKNGWTGLDNLHFTYGKMQGLAWYEAKDTLTNPKHNIQAATEFLRVLKEAFPLVQFNVFGHSLGAYLALEAAREHMDAINNLFLLSGPLRGINGTLDKRALAQVGKQASKAFLGVEEQVSDYFFNLWEDKQYQKEIDDFSQRFVATGRGLVCATSKEDKVVPSESAILEGATNIILAEGSGLNLLGGHGVPLSSWVLINEANSIIGKNLVS